MGVGGMLMAKELPFWEVARIHGNKAKVVGLIHAKDAKSAIAAIVKEKGVPTRKSGS
jgi:hypothetical protein